MKRIILFLLLAFSFLTAKAQYFYEPVTLDGTTVNYDTERFMHFMVLDSITEYGYGNWDYHFRLYPKELLKVKQEQVWHLSDSLNTKLNTSDISSWAKQPLKPIYSTSEITGYTDPINYTAGTGIDISSGVISTTAKRQETYSGTTNASGQYTVVFSNSYSVAPNIQANIIGAPDNQNIRITSIGTTGFTVTVRNRTDVVGLLPTWSNVNGASVDVLITQK